MGVPRACGGEPFLMLNFRIKLHIPRVSGDEPLLMLTHLTNAQPFPALAGVSRC